jgi:hypothetical protein
MIGRRMPQIYNENLSNPQIVKIESPEKKEKKEYFNQYYNQTEGNRSSHIRKNEIINLETNNEKQ